MRPVHNQFVLHFLCFLMLISGSLCRMTKQKNNRGTVSMGDQIDSFLFGDFCRRDSLTTIRKTCESIKPICPSVALKRSSGDTVLPCPTCPDYPSIETNTFCEDFATTSPGRVTITTNAHNLNCAFAFINDDNYELTCEGDLDNPAEGITSPLKIEYLRVSSPSAGFNLNTVARGSKNFFLVAKHDGSKPGLRATCTMTRIDKYKIIDVIVYNQRNL